MSKALTITVPVENCKCQFTQAQLDMIRANLERFNGKAVVVSFAKPKSTRSLKANAYYWSQVITPIARDTGNDPEAVHAFLKETLLPRRFVKLGSHEMELRKSTAELSVGAFSEYVMKCIAWAGTELGISIDPTWEAA